MTIYARLVSLVVFLILLGVAIFWKNWPDGGLVGFLPNFIFGALTSLAAALFVIFFVTFRDSELISKLLTSVKSLQDLAEGEENFDKNFELDEIRALLRNKNVKKDDWVKLIEELDDCKKPAYFVGRSLKRWIKSGDYAPDLKIKLRSRAVQAKELAGKGGTVEPVFFILESLHAKSLWAEFLTEVTNDLAVDFSNLGFKIIENSSNMPYSAVFCGQHGAITFYTINRSVEDSITVFLKPSGNIFRHLYLNDILKLLQLHETKP